MLLNVPPPLPHILTAITPSHLSHPHTYHTLTTHTHTGSTSTYGLLELRLILGGLWSGISGTPTVIRMCPPLTTKNWSFYTPLLAVGSTNGSILVFNLSQRTLVKEFAVHTCAVQ